jgi:8-oxo-dGTP diphosphatase
MSFTKKISGIDMESELRSYSEQLTRLYLPSVAINTVIFSFNNEKLNVLLLRFSDTQYFMLPGGFVLKDESLDDASLRILRERTGLKNIYLEQFYTSGDTNRKNEDIVREKFRRLNVNIPENSWMSNRYISVCYYALIDETKVTPKITEFFITGFDWIDVQKLPPLLYDHQVIIEKAISTLQNDLDQKLIAHNLVNETFTMGDLQKLYEAVFQKKFMRNNFQRKMLGLNILERLEKRYSGESHKAPYLYKFKKV